MHILHFFVTFVIILVFEAWWMTDRSPGTVGGIGLLIWITGTLWFPRSPLNRGNSPVPREFPGNSPGICNEGDKEVDVIGMGLELKESR